VLTREIGTYKDINKTTTTKKKTNWRAGYVGADEGKLA